MILEAKMTLGWIRLQNIILFCLKYIVYASKPKEFQPKNICVYRIGNIGDLLCTIPALWQIRRHYPEAKITLLSSPGEKNAVSALQVLKGLDCLDDIQIYYREDIHGFAKLKDFRRRLQKMEFDYFLQIPVFGARFLSQVRNIVFFRFVGFIYADSFCVSEARFFFKAQKEYLNRPKESERCMLNLPFSHDNQVTFTFSTTDDDEHRVYSVLENQLLEGNRPMLAISFSGKGHVKHWPLDRFSEIAQRWIQKNEGYAVIIGGKAEKAKADEILKGMPPEIRKYAFNFCGLYTISQSLFFLKQCKLLLTIDTGTAHMAAVTGTLCVDLSSAYNLPNQWFPYGKNIRVLRKEQKCSPCGIVECPYGRYAKCMCAIGIDEVWCCITELCET